MSAGTLYIMATPLGNLEDLTLRGVRTLKEADLVAAEDTRRTRKLLSHLGVSPPLISYREENHAKVRPRILGALREGSQVVLVSDAGAPGVSDPGALLAAEAAASGASVVPIPGPSAVTTALSVSGLKADAYVFAGFLPAKSARRRQALERLVGETRTLVFFEAPHRLNAALGDLADILGDRRAVICREMTKINEEFLRGGLKALAADLAGRAEPLKGEMTLVVDGAPEADAGKLSRDEVVELVQADGRRVKEIVADLAGRTELSRSDLYRLVLEASGRAGD